MWSHAIAASDIVMTRNSAIADKPRDAFLQNVACKYAPRYYPAKNVRYKSNGMSIIAEIRLKKINPSPPESFKVIGTDADRSAILNDFLVTFHSNHGPTCHYRFWDKKTISVESSKFVPSTCIYRPCLGFPWNWVTVLGLRNWNDGATW